MDAVEGIKDLDGAAVVAHTEDAWGPSGKLRIDGIQASGSEVIFDLLVPTSPHDIWDYIWTSEKKRGSTDKVQLFQAGNHVTGSQVTAISREGEDERWDARGPEQYRLTFSVPATAITDMPVEIRFFWSEKLMSTAMSSRGGHV